MGCGVAIGAILFRGFGLDEGSEVCFLNQPLRTEMLMLLIAPRNVDGERREGRIGFNFGIHVIGVQQGFDFFNGFNGFRVHG